MRLRTDRVLLPEGRIDKRFFKKLIEIRDLGDFDFPWPWIEGEPYRPPSENYFGCDGFWQMLAALDAHIDREDNEIRGILIVADAGDASDETFKKVCDQIERVRNGQTGDKFPVPTQPMKLERGMGRMPSIEIMLMPLSGKGSLETLFVDYLRRNGAGIYPSAFNNAKCYLTTPPTDISAWSKENRDKAYLQCMVAGTHEKDPAIPAQQLFSGKHQLIDLKDPFFDPVCNQIAGFCKQLP